MFGSSCRANARAGPKHQTVQIRVQLQGECPGWAQTSFRVQLQGECPGWAQTSNSSNQGPAAGRMPWLGPNIIQGPAAGRMPGLGPNIKLFKSGSSCRANARAGPKHQTV